MLSAEAVRALAWESAMNPAFRDPVATLIDVATQAEDAHAGRHAVKQFMQMYTDTLRRQLGDVARKLREERE